MRRTSILPAVVFLSLSVGAAACVAHTDGMVFHRTQAPALPEGCPVNRIASDTAPYPVEDLVTITVRYLPGGRDRTFHKLDNDACYYGGDTVYKIKEEPLNNVATQVTATIARRPFGAASSSAASTSSPPASTSTVGPGTPPSSSSAPAK
jgi:hypothetical protein